MLKGTFKNSYLKTGRDGVNRRIYVYGVTGSPEEVASYIAAQDENLEGGAIKDPETGEPVFFSVRRLKNTIKLSVTQNNKIAVDDDSDPFAAAEAAINQAQSPALQAALANRLADDMVKQMNLDFGGLAGTKQRASAIASEEMHEEEEEAESMESVLGKKTTAKK